MERENEQLRQQLEEAQQNIERLKQTTPTIRHAPMLLSMEGSEHNDDSTVFSNASTVKASGTPRSRRQNKVHISTPIKKEPQLLLTAPSTPSTVVSEDTAPASRRLLQLWKKSERLIVWKRTEPKLSEAALQLANLEQGPTPSSRRKFQAAHQELPLTMERYLHSDTSSSTRSCSTLAEF